ncbi:hypothetical protein MMP74_18435 [Acinetobacter sp. NIPH 1869]|uniref:hypothetical protein n=1 Tax=Acinetobacter higginsii TaxID=70347 RepID=UPI001F4BA96D|nr:hypothetical protein [Acinetobacter higginsii]MCH7306328.1 hypothetical protein [Acinetobacter higginsii]
MPYNHCDTYIEQALNQVTDTSDFMQFYIENLALFRHYVHDNYLVLAERLKKGTGIIQSPSDILSYMVLYGGFLYQCFDQTTQQIFKEHLLLKNNASPIHLVDYACGQGSASLVLIDRLMAEKQPINELHITLIEPSDYSMERAKKLIRAKATHYGIKLTLKCYVCTFDTLDEYFLAHAAHHQIFHLFANILDLYSFGSFDLEALVTKMKLIPAQHSLIAMSTKHPKSFQSNDTLGFKELHRLVSPNRLLIAKELRIPNIVFYKHSLSFRRMVTESKNMIVYACQWAHGE